MTMRSLPTESVEDFSSALFPDSPTSPHLLASVGRLQMASDYRHEPVLVGEVVTLLGDRAPGLLVDATIGGGGHALALLNAASETQRLLGLDRDPIARAAATERLSGFDNRVRIVDAQFGDLAAVFDTESPFISDEPVTGVLLDLGVSSEQLDRAERGFSYRFDAPLDMRMDPTRGETAAQLLDRVSADELIDLFRRHGEGRFARALARRIKEKSPKSTFELVAAVEAAIPAAARRRGHVAARVFQALRVELNDEEGELERALSAALENVAVGGVVVVISYHSGEDRAVKRAFIEAATGGCTCDARLGCVCGRRGRFSTHRSGAILATPDEIARNPRARSARLRAVRRVLA